MNVQGDEPLMPPALIDQVAQLLAGDRAGRHRDAARASSTRPRAHRSERREGGLRSQRPRAVLLPRADPLESRCAGSSPTPAAARRHIGIYAYRVSALRGWPGCRRVRLEQIEKLEQLRALENGMEIRVALAVERPLADVNTAADLERAERALACGHEPAMAASTALNIYPVKSCRGIALRSARVARHGLADDRHWMLVRPNGRFVTQRELPRMALIGTTVTPSGCSSARPACRR